MGMIATANVPIIKRISDVFSLNFIFLSLSLLVVGAVWIRTLYFLDQPSNSIANTGTTTPAMALIV
jgi:hypothetical protein